MAVTALAKPDFRTIAAFRQRHREALGALFVQVLQLCAAAGLVKLGHVALDGTKVKANASRHCAMSYQRMLQREQELRAEVASWFAAAQAADTGEDEQFGAEQPGDELPAWVVSKQARLAKIAEAKAALEAEAAGEAPAEKPVRAGQAGPDAAAEPAPAGSESAAEPEPPPPPAPDPKAQRNFTDPESKIMKTHDGWQQAYNAQAAVDASSGVIVAAYVTGTGSDSRELLPLLDQVEADLGRYPEQASADQGYCSEANLAGLAARGIDGYVATGRQRHGTASATGEAAPKTGTLRARMHDKLREEGWDSPYHLRKQTVEPVFGQIKGGRGFLQFLTRGLAQVNGEWALVCCAHNLLKLAGRMLGR